MVGMMGAGKTTIGRALAKALDVDFLDSDHEIETAANMSIADIFSRDGEGFFRDREREVIQRLLRNGPSVLSTGGGAYVCAEIRDMISNIGCAVWLKVDLDLLWGRVRQKKTRPLLMTTNPRDTLAQLLDTRTPYYQKAELVIDVKPNESIADTVNQIIDALKKREILEV